MQFRDYYQVLGVARDATRDELKRAYRKLARKFHPDVSKEKDAESRFKEVGEAYEVLKDPEKRAAYDRFGSNWKAGQDFQPPPDWDAGFEFRGAGDAGRGFSDFFESLFGGPGPFAAAGSVHSPRQRFRARGEDHHAKIMISVEDAFRGGQRNVELKMPELDSGGHVMFKHRRLNVGIPPGVLAGQQIRLAGQGGPGTGGGDNGDLYLEVEFEPHRVFSVKARDICSQLRITPWEAALGARVPVETAGGRVELAVPAGTQSGQRLRLKGRGMPGNPAGDHYVELRIVTPPARDESSRRFYQQMAGHFDFNPRREQTS